MDAPSPPLAEQSSPEEARRPSALRGALRLGLKGAVLLGAVAATLLAIVYLVPEGNDYAEATLLKHNRLAHYATRKIVLVGGSNLAFGVDSTMIERATGCPVVNMGMNGYLGVRYMLQEVKAELHPSDVVVMAFEWDNFYKSVDGTATDLLAMAKVNPAVFTYLSPRQILRVIAAIPEVAQYKAMRLLAETIVAVKNRVSGGSEEPEPDEFRIVENIESLRGFTPEGDLVSHLGVPWPYPRENGIIPKSGRIETQMISLMRDFAAEMEKRGVAVIVSYTPVIRYFFDQYHQNLAEAHKMISAAPPLVAPSPPSAFVYDEPYFFDTVYHLNAEGRPLRTQKLIDDLKSQLHERVLCPQTAAAHTGE